VCVFHCRYANSFAHAAEDLTRLSQRPDVSRSTTLQTGVAAALQHLGGPVAYAGRVHAFFTKFLEAAKTTVGRGSISGCLGGWVGGWVDQLGQR
jgi:hypothetical protein